MSRFVRLGDPYLLSLRPRIQRYQPISINGSCVPLAATERASLFYPDTALKGKEIEASETALTVTASGRLSLAPGPGAAGWDGRVSDYK
jgi:hypothetical protein